MKENLPLIDEKRTVHEMKNRLQYLKYYCANIRLHSVLYGDEQEELYVEDGVQDYLHYTKSIVHIDTKKTYLRHDPIVKAMAKQDQQKEALTRRDASAYVLLQGIAQLSQVERELLLDTYVRQLDRNVMMTKAGGIAESTYHRRLHKAILHLAIVMHCVIMKDNTCETGNPKDA